MDFTNSLTQTFTKFPELAPELRLQIWNEAFPSGRCVEIKRNIMRSSIEPDDTAPWAPSCSSLVPSLFFVCREARAVVLSTYIPIRGTDPSSAVVYWNPERDVMCFRYQYYFVIDISRFLIEFSQLTGKDVQHIAVENALMYQTPAPLWFPRENLCELRNLREVVLADDESWTDNTFHLGIMGATVFPASEASRLLRWTRGHMENKFNEYKKTDSEWEGPLIRFGSFTLE